MLQPYRQCSHILALIHLNTSKKVVSELTIYSLNICHIYSLLRKVPLKGMKKET